MRGETETLRNESSSACRHWS